ncbi:MAG: hypothetical protein ACRD1Z_18465 [Vicinamibacteria bacterium]
MVTDHAAAAIASLETRVAFLEERLRARSRVLRALAQEVCEADLIRISRVAAGRPPHPGSDSSLMGFREDSELVAADVEATLEELWRSLLFPRPTPGR